MHHIWPHFYALLVLLHRASRSASRSYVSPSSDRSGNSAFLIFHSRNRAGQLTRAQLVDAEKPVSFSLPIWRLRVLLDESRCTRSELILTLLWSSSTLCLTGISVLCLIAEIRAGLCRTWRHACTTLFYHISPQSSHPIIEPPPLFGVEL
jgi:hypothetical protein